MSKIRFCTNAVVVLQMALAGCGERADITATPPDEANSSSKQAVSPQVVPPAISNPNVSEINVGSHRVKTILDVPASTDFTDETATIRFGGRKALIDFEKEQVSLDERHELKLPAGTKSVEIQFLSGKLSIAADGADVVIPGDVN